MTTNFFSAVLQYFNAWLLMLSTLAAAVAAEKIYLFAAAMTERRLSGREPMIRSLRSFFRTEITLPQGARLNFALYCPALAFAALMTICASIPFCTYIPIIDNGADIIQIIQFMLLSELFILLSLCSLRTAGAAEAARAEIRNVIRLLVPLVSCCAALAAFLMLSGLDGDPFSLNSFSIAGQMTSMSLWGFSGIFLFVFAILSQTPRRDIFSGTLLLRAGEIPEFNGVPRGMVQIWSVFRSFIVVAVVTYVIFPSNLIAGFNSALGISWRGQALNFLIFWSAVVAMRLFAVPFCWMTIAAAERLLPRPLRGSLLYVITFIALLLLWYEGILFSQEAAAF
ncbi:MAG: hypothetical protein Q4D58_11085 [Synergistaceae bacterium]|nr:hypothetical protein [Synergistaceae bacterium]